VEMKRHNREMEILAEKAKSGAGLKKTKSNL
jgi:hypothetical protein